jgi:hypothetical protein
VSLALSEEGGSSEVKVKGKKKAKNTKSEGQKPLQPASPEVAHLLALMLKPASQPQDNDDLLNIVRDFMAGWETGLVEPAVLAVAVSLTEQIAKVSKKERPGILAVLRRMVDQSDPASKRRRYKALFAPAEDAVVGVFNIF